MKKLLLLKTLLSKNVLATFINILVLALIMFILSFGYLYYSNSKVEETQIKHAIHKDEYYVKLNDEPEKLINDNKSFVNFSYINSTSAVNLEADVTKNNISILAYDKKDLSRFEIPTIKGNYYNLEENDTFLASEYFDGQVGNYYNFKVTVFDKEKNIEISKSIKLKLVGIFKNKTKLATFTGSSGFLRYDNLFKSLYDDENNINNTIIINKEVIYSNNLSTFINLHAIVSANKNVLNSEQKLKGLFSDQIMIGQKNIIENTKQDNLSSQLLALPIFIFLIIIFIVISIQLMFFIYNKYINKTYLFSLFGGSKKNIFIILLYKIVIEIILSVIISAIILNISINSFGINLFIKDKGITTFMYLIVISLYSIALCTMFYKILLSQKSYLMIKNKEQYL